jgi:hypothetical protein
MPCVLSGSATYLSLDISVPRRVGKVWHCRGKEIRPGATRLRLPSIQTALNILQDEMGKGRWGHNMRHEIYQRLIEKQERIEER